MSMTLETARKIARSAAFSGMENASTADLIRRLHRAALSHLALTFLLWVSTAPFRYTVHSTALDWGTLVGSSCLILFILFRVVRFTQALNVLADHPESPSAGT